MTTKYQPKICDGCKSDIEKDDSLYTAQFGQRSAKPTKGQFITCENKADFCQKCFMGFCGFGFKPKWVKKIQQENGTWKTEEIVS